MTHHEMPTCCDARVTLHVYDLNTAEYIRSSFARAAQRVCATAPPFNQEVWIPTCQMPPVGVTAASKSIRPHGEASRAGEENIRGDAEEGKRWLKCVRAALWRVERERLRAKLHQMEGDRIHHRASEQRGRRTREETHRDAKRANDLKGC